MSEPVVELWGFLLEDVENVREDVERLLGVTFRLHESESIGPYYFAELDDPESELILRPNLDAGFDEDTDDLIMSEIRNKDGIVQSIKDFLGRGK